MKKGFTLIELLVVITIILVMSGIGVVSYTGAQRNARNSKRKADLEQLRSALEMYRDDNDVYPPDLDKLKTEGYIDSKPIDPKYYDYYYNPSPGPDPDYYTYSLCAYLEGGGPDDCGSNCGSAPGNCNYQVNNP